MLRSGDVRGGALAAFLTSFSGQGRFAVDHGAALVRSISSGGAMAGRAARIVARLAVGFCPIQSRGIWSAPGRRPVRVSRLDEYRARPWSEEPNRNFFALGTAIITLSCATFGLFRNDSRPEMAALRDTTVATVCVTLLGRLARPSPRPRSCARSSAL